MKNFNKVLIQQAEKVGSHLTEYLVEKGHKVKAFVRYNSRNFWGWLEKSKYIDDIAICSVDFRDYNN